MAKTDLSGALTGMQQYYNTQNYPTTNPLDLMQREQAMAYRSAEATKGRFDPLYMKVLLMKSLQAKKAGAQGNLNDLKAMNEHMDAARRFFEVSDNLKKTTVSWPSNPEVVKEIERNTRLGTEQLMIGKKYGERYAASQGINISSLVPPMPTEETPEAKAIREAKERKRQEDLANAKKQKEEADRMQKGPTGGAVVRPSEEVDPYRVDNPKSNNLADELKFETKPIPEEAVKPLTQDEKFQQRWLELHPQYRDLSQNLQPIEGKKRKVK